MIHLHKPFGADGWRVVDERSSSGILHRIIALTDDLTLDEARELCYRVQAYIAEHPDWRDDVDAMKEACNA